MNVVEDKLNLFLSKQGTVERLSLQQED